MNQENKPESYFNRHLDESLESWKLRLEAINNTDAFKMCQAMVEKQEPSCYGDIALLMLEYASQHSYTEQKYVSEVECLKQAINQDKTGLAKGLSDVYKLAKSYDWIKEGRGPYAFDDEYRLTELINNN